MWHFRLHPQDSFGNIWGIPATFGFVVVVAFGPRGGGVWQVLGGAENWELKASSALTVMPGAGDRPWSGGSARSTSASL